MGLYQGEINVGSGNLFKNASDLHINNEGEAIIYFWKVSEENTWAEPSLLDGNITSVEAIEAPICGPFADEVVDESDAQYLLWELEEEKENLISGYLALLDGGSTDELVDEIVWSTFAEATSFTYSLLEKSPYLSEQALIKAIEEEFDLPNALLLLILQANTQATRNSSIQGKLDTKLILFFDFERELINQGLAIVSQKENLEGQIALVNLNIAQVCDFLIRMYLENGETDKLISLLDAGRQKSHYYLLAAHYLRHMQIADCTAVLDRVPMEVELSEEAILEHDQMVEYFNVQVTAILRGAYDSEFYVSNESMVNEHTYFSQAAARGYNRLIPGYEYLEPFPASSLGQPRQLQENSVDNLDNPFIMYPNPSSTFVLLKWNSHSSPDNGQVALINQLGQLVYSNSVLKGCSQVLIPVEELNNGSYILQVRFDSGVVQSEKLVVKHE